MKKVLLCCDGGGIRGAATAQFLARLEEAINKPLQNMIDVFAGTSTGSMIALGLGVCGFSTAEISRLYNHMNSSLMMNKSIWDRILGLAQTMPKYDGNGKTSILRKTLGETNKRMGDMDPEKIALAVAYDVEQRRSVVYKSTAYSPGTGPLVADIADGSSAAPLYFPTKNMPQPDNRWLIDGGVVANNPTMCAVAEAIRKWSKQILPDLHVLSVGSGNHEPKINGPESADWGAIGWIRNDLLSIMMDQDVVDYQARMVLGEQNYLRVNSALASASPELDDTSEENIKNLKALGDSWFEEFGPRAIQLIQK